MEMNEQLKDLEQVMSKIQNMPEGTLADNLNKYGDCSTPEAVKFANSIKKLSANFMSKIDEVKQIQQKDPLYFLPFMNQNAKIDKNAQSIAKPNISELADKFFNSKTVQDAISAKSTFRIIGITSELERQGIKLTKNQVNEVKKQLIEHGLFSQKTEDKQGSKNMNYRASISNNNTL